MNAISTINLEKEQRNDASNVLAPPSREKKAVEPSRKGREKEKKEKVIEHYHASLQIQTKSLEKLIHVITGR